MHLKEEKRSEVRSAEERGEGSASSFTALPLSLSQTEPEILEHTENTNYSVHWKMLINW